MFGIKSLNRTVKESEKKLQIHLDAHNFWEECYECHTISSKSYMKKVNVTTEYGGYMKKVNVTTEYSGYSIRYNIVDRYFCKNCTPIYNKMTINSSSGVKRFFIDSVEINKKGEILKSLNLKVEK